MPYFLITVIKNVNSFCSLHYYVSSSKLAKALVKRTRKFPRNYTQVAKKNTNILRQTILLFLWLITG